MQPDRQVELRHQLEERQRLGRGQGRAQHVGEHLHADGVELANGAFCFVEQPFRIVHRQRGDERRKAVAVLGHQLRHAVVGKPCELGR